MSDIVSRRVVEIRRSVLLRLTIFWLANIRIRVRVQSRWNHLILSLTPANCAYITWVNRQTVLIAVFVAAGDEWLSSLALTVLQILSEVLVDQLHFTRLHLCQPALWSFKDLILFLTHDKHVVVAVVVIWSCLRQYGTFRSSRRCRWILID